MTASASVASASSEQWWRLRWQRAAAASGDGGVCESSGPAAAGGIDGERQRGRQGSEDTEKLDEENVSIDTAQAASWHDHHQQQQTPPLATRAGHHSCVHVNPARTLPRRPSSARPCERATSSFRVAPQRVLLPSRPRHGPLDTPRVTPPGRAPAGVITSAQTVVG